MFDGYGNSSMKDHEHVRRSMNSPPCPDFKVQNDTQLHYSQNVFLTNDEYKIQLINLLTEEFLKEGHVVSRSRDDADTLIV